MDDDLKEALLDNEDGEDEGDNVEEVAESGVGDELSSDEGGEPSNESRQKEKMECYWHEDVNKNGHTVSVEAYVYIFVYT